MNRPVPLWVLLLAGALLWGGEYVRRDLWEPDEARYTLVSIEMREGGHWLIPHRQGAYYTHKPPLMFWLTNVFAFLTGGEIGQVAPRLPSFLGAMMALWAVSRLASIWHSHRAAWLTVALLMTSFLFWNKGGFGQIDALLCGLEMMALYFLFTHNRTPATWRLILAYIFMGLGVLAKGPVGLIVPLGAYVTASLAGGERSALRGWHWIWGTLIALTLPGIWLLGAWWQGAPDGFFDELLFKQTTGRVAGEFGGHVRPFYYYLMYFPLDFLPWTILLPIGYVAIRKSPEHTVLRRQLLGWIGFVILFFSLSASKRNLYILLVYPAAAMMLAAGWHHLENLKGNGVKYTSRMLSVVIGLIGAGMLVAVLIKNVPLNAWWLWPGGLVLLAGGVVLVRFSGRDFDATRWLWAACGIVLAHHALFGALVYPAFDDFKTPDELIEVVRKWVPPDEHMIVYMEHGEIYSLYTGRLGHRGNSPEELRELLDEHPHGLIILRPRHVEIVQSAVGDPLVSGTFIMGSKERVWLAYDVRPRE